MIRELIGPVPNSWDNTLKGYSEEWTPAVSRNVYRLWKGGGVRTAERMDEYLEREFRNTVIPKDGYIVRELKDPKV